MNSITTNTENFICSLKDHVDCSNHPDCIAIGRLNYTKLIQWISTNPDHEDCDRAITDIFALLNELHKKRGLTKEVYCDLTKKAIKVIKDSKGDLSDPYLIDFLKQKQKALKE